jgi:hypothetical protein
MDEWSYEVKYCPFCSENIKEEHEDVLFDEDEDEDY